jgi:hypothetical protein
MTWADAIQQAILEVEPMPYGRGPKTRSGCPTDIEMNGKMLMRAAEPPVVNCCGMASWVLFRAMEIVGTLDLLGYGRAETLREYIFVLGWEKQPIRLQGGPQGLVDLGLGSFVSAEEAQIGDLVHCQWSAIDDPKSGHSVIATEYMADFKGSPALWAFSANCRVPKYDPPYDWAKDHLPRALGAQHDYFRTMNKPGRRFWVGRLNPEWRGEARY